MKTLQHNEKCNASDLILVNEGLQCSRCMNIVKRNAKSIPPSPPSKEERIQRLIDLGFDVFPETALEKQDW